MGELLSTAETARRLGVTPDTLLRWAREGKLPAYRVGERLFRFASDDVERFIRSTDKTSNSGVGVPA